MEPENTQINIAIPTNWKTRLQQLSRIHSAKEDTDLTYLDLIRIAIKEKYLLTDETTQNLK